MQRQRLGRLASKVRMPQAAYPIGRRSGHAYMRIGSDVHRTYPSKAGNTIQPKAFGEVPKIKEKLYEYDRTCNICTGTGGIGLALEQSKDHDAKTVKAGSRRE